MVEVKICSGTVCYVMGGTDLFLLSERLTKKEIEKVNVVFVPCLGYCKEKNKKPPFAIVNGKLYEKLDVNSLVSIVKREIRREKDADTKE